MLRFALSASDISAGMCTWKLPPNSSKTICVLSRLQVWSLCVSCLAVSPALSDWQRLLRQCDLSLMVLGLAFPEGTCGCRTCTNVIGCKFVFIPHYNISIIPEYLVLTCPLVLNCKTFSAELLFKERLTSDVWSFCSSGVKGAVMGWLKIYSTLSGDDAGLVFVVQPLARCSFSFSNLRWWSHFSHTTHRLPSVLKMSGDAGLMVEKSIKWGW